MPHYCAYDVDQQLLILELLRDAKDLNQHHMRTGRFSTDLAYTMGKALAQLHSLEQAKLYTDSDMPCLSRPPSALTIHRPHLSTVLDASQAKLQLISIIQGSEELCRLLDDVRDGWQADRLMHGDIKWANWITFATSSSTRRIKLIDWELASLGDPCWDIGSALASYVSFWLSSVPITGEEALTGSLEHARYPLENMRRAIQSLWASYVESISDSKSAADHWLLRAVRYVAIRLVQSALEQVQASATLTGNVIYITQLALNILKRPYEASAQLFGLPIGSLI